MSEYYKLLIVDDEEEVRQGMFCGIDWERFGFQAVAQAGNGLEAMSEVEKHKPDVVLTDIRMDGMDGMELIGYLAEKHPDIKVVLLSGFSDLEYYQTALRMKVFDYILKPSCPKDFESVFGKLKKELDGIRFQHRKMENLTEHFERSFSKEHISFLCSWMQGLIPSDEEIKRGRDYYRVKFPEENLAVIIFTTLTGGEKNQSVDAAASQKMLRCLSSELQGKGQFVNSELFPFEKNVVCITECSDVTKLAEGLSDTIRRIRQKYGMLLFGGVSECCCDELLLSCYFSQAQLAMRQSVFFEKEDIVFYRDVVAATKNLTSRYGLDYTHCIERLFKDDKESFEREIAELFSKFYGKLRLNYDYLDSICNNLYYTALQHAEQLGLYFPETENFYAYLSKMHSLREKESYTRDAIEGIYLMTKQVCQSGQKNVVSEIDKMLEEEYADPEMSLLKISERIGRSSAYISAVYKQETGKNIIDEITLRRMEKAKEYLEETNLKIYVIAAQVGYQDCSYFTRVFRKNTGIGPSEYRKNRKRQ